MMNYGPPPPPPPPPFSTGAPAAPPAPKPAPEVMPKASPPVAVPAALAGAMMKDKKPFTYTPGGLNLAEINAQNQPQQNGVPVMVHSQGVHDPVMQSRSFKVLQNAYDNQDPTGGQQLQSDNPQEPKKYMGSHIPSRSFRMLQAMTDADDVQSDDLKPTNPSTANREAPHAESIYNSTTVDSRLPSLSSSSSQTRLIPITLTSTSASGTDERDIGSRVAPSYTSTVDSHVYRHVVPKLIGNSGPERVVNSALSAKRDSSPKPWNRESPPSTIVRSSLGPESKNASPTDLESPSRLRTIIKQEDPSANNEVVNKKLYEGSSIPSRAFKQLQNDYSIRDSGSGTAVPSSNQVAEIHVPRIMQNLQLDHRQSSNSSPNDLEDQYRNGVLETASAKESVLKELTSQFDPQMSLKKPKAAPGRVFRYLQQQYDDPQDSDFVSMSSNSNNPSSSVSPTRVCSSPVSSGIDVDNPSDVEPKPYVGCRIPGRTFRLLQENMDSHPSVLQARK